MEEMLIKRTIARLREAQGDEQATRIVVIEFLRERLLAGLSLDQAVSTLAVGHDSVFRRISYSQTEEERLIQILRSCSVAEILEFGNKGSEI